MLMTQGADTSVWPLVAVRSTLNTTNPVPHVAPLGVIWHTSILLLLARLQVGLIGSERPNTGAMKEPERLSGAGT
jgi:hypothetical protein